MKLNLKILPSLALMLSAAAVCVFGYYFLDAPAMGRSSAQTATVVIDPGHGGEDGGASSTDGVLESGLNLEISLRLRDLLTFVGFPTKMVRETDTSVYSDGCGSIAEKKVSDLKNRVQFVNATPNAILVSIHQNFFEEAKYDGAQVFFAGTEGSEELANLTQEALRQTLDHSNRRQAKRSQSVYLMEHITCPGILVECGFLSNYAECENLQEPGYQQKIAAAVCQAVLNYENQGSGTDEV